ncbi:hypothetical protein [Sphingobacterium paramultivorum]|uniref:hypothetical protein n=1 Tax=Sphingobacterium paramultivorum TaxID=2886510 RepID=UPI00129C75A6|nr:hypothetical protein [Sphingobacterium paramultivorum]
MLNSIFRKLIYAVFAIILLQSCERDNEMYPQTDETSVAKKWYDDNGKPYPLDWAKSQLIKIDNENTKLVVPLENGTNLGPDNSMQQNLVFTIQGNNVTNANKVKVLSDTRTVVQFSEEAITNFVKKQGYRSKDLGKVYFMIYDLNDNLLNSQLLDATGLKQVNLQLKIKDDDTKVKDNGTNSVTGKNIPVVCSDWYLVEYFDDGSTYWMYLYTTCSGTASSGGGGGGSGGGSGTAASYFVESPTEPINLQQLIECFNNIPSNAQTTYKITIHTALAEPGEPYQVYNATDKTPGHAYITMQKTNGSASRSLTFGFYPSSDSWMSILKNAEDSSIGKEDDEKRRSDASYTINVTSTAFNNARNVALSGSLQKYDLNDFNCTNYAIQVFEAAMGGGTGLQVPNSAVGYKTPSSLYLRLSDMKTAGTAGISTTTTLAPTSTPPCN